jgi:hypothetical protein
MLEGSKGSHQAQMGATQAKMAMRLMHFAEAGLGGRSCRFRTCSGFPVLCQVEQWAELNDNDQIGVNYGY